ncbi:heavy-metal-associated domain-containing protein [Pedobacter sp. JCM 36344]|uniref:heavy-metal-associated domain-containing protein n=1 Tax=Pedobacter sp. JCM 36344 TaxID=3374280 RepID=UPI0039798752
MKKYYELKGMSCGGCVSNVKGSLLQLPDVENAEVQLHPQSAVLTMSKSIGIEELQAQLNRAGNYGIKEVDSNNDSKAKNVLPETKSATDGGGKNSCCS